MSSLNLGQSILHYRILNRLGSGGMGEVYLAEDTKLDRKVAIKFLSAESATDDGAKKRLVREARAAAKLDHPNICSIYEVGEEEGHSFIVMQHIEGKTLASTMQKKPLDLRVCLDVAAQVADALAEAHSHGIIHRDIKPQNIMITARGQAKVMDFGLAKVVREQNVLASEAETQSLLTDPGMIVGTLPYMSPEQVKGEVIDARSDIFSFGVMLYELVTGRQPFVAESGAATLAAILTREAPPLARYAPEAPEQLQRIVRKCLEKDRERRYQIARDVAIDLENVQRERETAQLTGSLGEQTTRNAAAATTDQFSRRLGLFRSRLGAVTIVLALIVIAAMVYALITWSAPTVRSEIKSLAVLPLENLSADPQQDYFADGMTEALISNLAQIRALRVISRTSIMRYKGSGKSLPEIAHELNNVDAVIIGSVQRSGGRVRVTAQLIYAATDSHLWARDYERDLTDVLKLQGEVARAVADEIRIQVTSEERARLASAHRVNPDAHEAYLLGRYHLSKLNDDDLKQAIEDFERAIQIAPDYAAAHAGLSDAWRERGIWGAKNFREAESPARDAALKAVALDPQLAEAHTSLGQIKYIYDWDWAGAEQEQRRALELDPGNPDAHTYYAYLLMALGRHAEAIREMESAELLDPLSSQTQSGFGRVLYRARKYEEAIPHLKRAIELEPRNYSAYVRLGDVYAKLSRYDEAIAAFEKAGELRHDGMHPARIARVYALMGRQREAGQMVRGVKGAAFDIASVYAVLGDKDEAFRILEKAVEGRDSLLVNFKEDPSYDNLHSDPRWKALLRRMNFPPE